MFVLDKSGDCARAFACDTELEIFDVDEHGRVTAECDYVALAGVSFDAFPESFSVRVHSSDGFGTFLFHEAEIFKEDSGKIVADYICHHPNKYWEGTWGLSTFLVAIKDQVPFYSEVSLTDIEVDDAFKQLTLRMELERGSVADALAGGAVILKDIIREAKVVLAGMLWKPGYATNERLFCEEVLAPLLRRMQFMSIRYTQGDREYGKDFTFSELTPFGAMRHYGLQAKAGDITGEVNSVIDQIVGQADDAFKMPYYDLSSADPRYISTFVVAASGRFTANAREKIIHKVPRGIQGSMLFLDREAILELVERYWRAD